MPPGTKRLQRQGSLEYAPQLLRRQGTRTEPLPRARLPRPHRRWPNLGRFRQMKSEQQVGAPIGTVPITIYTTTWCGDCVAAKAYFDAHGYSYAEVNIEEDEAAMRLVVDLNDGRRSVPTVVFGTTSASLSRFSPTKAASFLSRAGLAPS